MPDITDVAGIYNHLLRSVLIAARDQEYFRLNRAYAELAAAFGEPDDLLRRDVLDLRDRVGIPRGMDRRERVFERYEELLEQHKYVNEEAGNVQQ